jgi:hypothetical protein
MRSANMTNVDKAIALLRENIATVPPHGCKRDEVLALLTMEPTQWTDTQQVSYLPKENHEDDC